MPGFWQMNQLIPWSEWVAMIKPCYYKGERGNKPYDLELMLRIYVLQMVYNVADMLRQTLFGLAAVSLSIVR